MQSSQSHIHTLRGLRYHVRTWGNASAPKIFLLHGWMDVSASFQFLVDCFAQDFYVVAPDWRGFGLTAWAPGGYWFPDYYADLDALLELYQPDAPANLVAHSMGGNIATAYAGMRPERVAKLVSLEGFGASRTQPGDAPKRYKRWLAELRDPPLFTAYKSFDEVAARLKVNDGAVHAESRPGLGFDREQVDPVTLMDRHRLGRSPILVRVDHHTGFFLHGHARRLVAAFTSCGGFSNI